MYVLCDHPCSPCTQHRITQLRRPIKKEAGNQSARGERGGGEEPFSCVRQAKLVMQPPENDLSQNENFEKTWVIF